LPDPLRILEQQRSEILSQILHLGGFRSGSITAINGRCGKPNCRCHRPGQPGHGPNFRLTRKVDGKTISESFSSAAELRKAQHEVETFHRFRQLSRELLEVNEKICRTRPVEQILSPEEKSGRISDQASAISFQPGFRDGAVHSSQPGPPARPDGTTCDLGRRPDSHRAAGRARRSADAAAQLRRFPARRHGGAQVKRGATEPCAGLL
jgi:hypothetical protein